MNLPHIAILLNWRKENNKSGLYPIHIRIKIGNQARYFKIPVPQKVKESEWSGHEDGWVKSSHTFAFEINNKIREHKNIINDIIKRSYTFNKTVTITSIMGQLKRKGDRHSFYDFMQQYIDAPPEKLEENTLKKYRTSLTHLKKCRSQLQFADIDAKMISDFHQFMQKELNLEGAACKKYMEAFKKVIRYAAKENYLDPTNIELFFDDIKIKVPKAKRVYLEPKEIKAWKDLKFSKAQPELERDRDMFLFQIYTGYYYKDLFIFTKNQLMEDEEYGYIIHGARDKNGNETIIPLFKFPYAAAIITKYRSNTDSKMVFDHKHLISEPVYNRNLKDIAEMAKIHKNVCNKVGRHTNAQLWVRYGAEGNILSKMMGHLNGETTRNYYEVNIPEIIEGTKRADFKKLGI